MIKCVSAHVDACACVCVNLCMCVRCHSQVSSLSSALKLMIWGPENQQIWPPAGHNGEHDLPTDVFEDCSSFFSVNTLPTSTQQMHLQHKLTCDACVHAVNEEVCVAMRL